MFRVIWPWLAAGFVILGSSCKKTEVLPGTGGISGSVLSANSASRVYLIQETDTLILPLNADGTFEKKEITPGNYTMSAEPVYGFAPPKPGPIIINAGYTTQAYPIRVPAMPDAGIFSVTINDTVFTGTPKYDLFGAPAFEVVSGPYAFRFELPKINKADTLNALTSPGLKMTLRFNKEVYEANQTTGSLGLRITQFEQTTRRGEVTFGFVATASGQPDITGTNGRINYAKLRP